MESKEVPNKELVLPLSHCEIWRQHDIHSYEEYNIDSNTFEQVWCTGTAW